MHLIITPAQAGIQWLLYLDTRLRGDDDKSFEVVAVE